MVTDQTQEQQTREQRQRHREPCFCRFIRSPHVRRFMGRIAYREALLAEEIKPSKETLDRPELPGVPEDWVGGIPLDNVRIHLAEDVVACHRLSVDMDRMAEAALDGRTWTLIIHQTRPEKEDARP